MRIEGRVQLNTRQPIQAVSAHSSRVSHKIYSPLHTIAHRQAIVHA